MIKATLAETAKAYTAEMLGVLVEIALDGRLAPGARATAAAAVLDRGHGKPPQAVEVTGKDGNPIETKDVTPRSDLDAARRIAWLLNAAASAPPPEKDKPDG